MALREPNTYYVCGVEETVLSIVNCSSSVVSRGIYTTVMGLNPHQHFPSAHLIGSARAKYYINLALFSPCFYDVY